MACYFSLSVHLRLRLSSGPITMCSLLAIRFVHLLLLAPSPTCLYLPPRLQVAVDAKFTSASMMAGKAPALSPSFMQQKHEGVYGSGAGAAGAAAAPLALPVMYALAQSGPSHDIQPAFDWRTTALNTFNLSHLGMPDVWDFGWVTVATDTSGATR